MRILKPLFTAAALASAIAAAPALAADITGAGATFPYPIYAKWADAYKKSSGTGLNYQSIGSGGGIKQITAKTVDFGASDMPLSADDLEKNGLIQFPAVMGGNVPVYNLKGVTAPLKFTGELLADIYLGKVKTWNDPAIQSLNKEVKLPTDAISVVYRSDGSGTTFIWTNYLSKVSADWKQKVGEGTAVSFPTGVGGKGNEGVAAYVQKINGAIGYVEYAYAKQNKLAYGSVKNKDGVFTMPGVESFKAAAAGADWAKAPGMQLILTEQPGKATWPITGATFILMHRVQDKPENAKEVLKFFDWAYANGDDMATQLDYVALPDPVVKLVKDLWKRSIKDKNGTALY